MNLPLRTPVEDQATRNSTEQDHTVTIVICTRNRHALLQKCLAAVSRLDRAPNQVLVVDNSEGDNETRRVAQFYGVRYTIEPVRGLSRARNRGLTECDTDIVGFLDDDVIPAPTGSVSCLHRFLTFKSGPPPAVSSHLALRTRGRSSKACAPSATRIHTGLRWPLSAAWGAAPTWHFASARCPSRGSLTNASAEAHPSKSAKKVMLSPGFSRMATASPISPLPSSTTHYPHVRALSMRLGNSFAYWLLFFMEFPGQRLNVLRFLIRRLCGKRLDWPRNPQEPGEIVSSSWRVLFRAGIKGLWLFIRTAQRSKSQEPLSYLRPTQWNSATQLQSPNPNSTDDVPCRTNFVPLESDPLPSMPLPMWWQLCSKIFSFSILGMHRKQAHEVETLRWRPKPS